MTRPALYLVKPPAPAKAPAAPCPVCDRAPYPDRSYMRDCDRCGTVMHDACSWRVAPLDEFRAYLDGWIFSATIPDVDLPCLCPACREARS